MTHSLQLLFQTSAPDDLLSGFHSAHVALKSFSTTDEHHFITPECVSIAELEGEVNRLHQELDDILGEARKKFST